MAVPVLVAASVVVFSMMHLAPGDAVDALLGPLRTEETEAQVRRQLGLDKPLYVQYFKWLGGAARGDLGFSVRLSQSVFPEVLAKLKNSALLALSAFLFAAFAGTAIGVVTAVYRGRTLDSLATAITVVGVSVAPFFLAMLFILIFAVKLPLLPPGGMYDVRVGPSVPGLLRHLILPSLALAAAPLTVIARMTRLSMLEVLGQDFIRTARSKGLSETAVMIRHALRNAIVPVLNVFGLQIGYLLSATALVEVVFSWPGLGSLLIQSVVTRDLVLAQGVILVIAFVYVVTNIFTDLMQSALDPRIEFR